MFVRDRQVVDFQGAHVRLDGFLHVGQRGILRFALGDAAGQARALGDPKAIFPAIDENLSHMFIMPDSEGDGWPVWAWASCNALRVSPRAKQNLPRSPTLLTGGHVKVAVDPWNLNLTHSNQCRRHLEAYNARGVRRVNRKLRAAERHTL
jgi:hypothetical protein